MLFPLDFRTAFHSGFHAPDLYFFARFSRDMNSYRDRLAYQQCPVSPTDARNHFFSPEQEPSEYSTLDLPERWTFEALRNNAKFGGNQPAGLGRTSWTASQPTKRMRSNSDEVAISLLSEVQALLLMANSDQLRKIRHLLYRMCQAFITKRRQWCHVLRRY